MSIEESVACIRSLTEQCAALVWERDELQKQVWRYEKHGVTCQTYGHKVESSCSECNVHKVYTTPPVVPRQWVGLTAEEIWACYKTDKPDPEYYILNALDFAEAIEAKLREKNDVLRSV